MSVIINGTGGGGGTPGAPPGSLQFNNAGAFGGVPNSAVDTNGAVILNTGVITAADPALTLESSWNAAVVMSAFKIAVTLTSAPGAGSLLFDAGTSNGPQVQIDYVGNMTVNGQIQANTRVAAQGSITTSTDYFIVANDTAGLALGASHDVRLLRAASGVLCISISGPASSPTGWYNYAGQARVTSDFPVTNSTVLTNVTGLTVTVQAGRSYAFDAYLSCTDAAAGGVQAAIAGTCTATSIIYDGWLLDSNTIKAQTNAAALATAVANTVTTATSGLVIRIKGLITVANAGTLTVQFAQNSSNGTASTVKQGSHFIVQDVP